MSLGFDTATTLTSTNVTALAGQGFSFACRYLTGTYAMTKTEAQAISAKMGVVSIFERSINPTYFTASQGSIDAAAAITAAKSLGQGTVTPIYMCVDFDATASQITSNLTPYFNAAKLTFDTASLNTSNYRLGIYGSKRVLKAFEGICPYRWLVDNSWGSGAPAYTNYNLRQYNWNVVVAGVNIDYDDTNGAVGSWKI